MPNTNSYIFIAILFYLKLRSRIRNRHYITKHDLIHKDYSAWKLLYNNQSDKAFIDSTGLNISTFNYLLNLIQQYNVTNNYSLCNKYRSVGRPNTLDISSQLALTLYHLNSTMKQKTLCQIFSATPGIVSRTIHNILKALNDVLSVDHNSRIEWSDEKSMTEFATQIKERHPYLPDRVFGFMDGVYFPCENNPDPQVQNRYYNGWKGGPTVTNILVFTPDGCISYAVLNFPGSINDNKLARRVYEMLEYHTTSDFKILADSAFQFAHRRIITPYKSNQLNYDNPLILEQQVRLHRRVIQARQAAEWGMGALQGIFGRLKLPLSGTDFAYNGLLLSVCCRLFNLRTRLMEEGNQIKTIFNSDYLRNMFRENSDYLQRFYNIV